ncbi:MAG: glycosyltransferase family 2 protein [Xanthomonadaceae bacterium]|jgi:glycosyltransferase involved in cell wall biosynthesis|nr:glycosyltransferase family 2 protein [Xanthomonadaceae bacterium]
MNAAAPLVSVVIPCFNARRWIEATIASVEAQTWRPLEIVVVDDGSTDGSGEWLQAQADRGRLRLVRQPNAGQPAAFNAALRIASGDFVQFLDADDILDPTKIELQLSRLKERPDCVATCEWGRFYGDDPSTASFVPELCWTDLTPPAWLAAAFHSGGGMLFPGLWLIPMALARSAGDWNESIAGRNPDGEYFVRVLNRSVGVLFCEGARVRYRSGIAGSMSRSSGRENLRRQLRSLELIEHAVSGWSLIAGVSDGMGLAYQRYAMSVYPYARDLAEAALERSRILTRRRLAPEGGWRFRVMASLLGWRLARRMQVWSGRP